MDVEGIIASFATGVYAVTRRPAAQFDGNGVAQTQAAVTLPPIVASVQAPVSTDLQRLPEGRREVSTLVVFTAFALQVGAQGGALEADRITINGALWEVQAVETWRQAAGANYYRAIVQAVEEQASP